ncbi:Hypp2509 [Branchiostoma lanceolatum]|uniref:Hypp2509 protein n=1 Tax=Branchiostoma lanceolatum TaxID=7740 RepID=A0A8J9ZSV8_BRALA|nr:Hypp2509 [Branchiostoma lanceolatum]
MSSPLPDLDKAPTFPLAVFHLSTGAFLWNGAEMGSISPAHSRHSTPAVTAAVSTKDSTTGSTTTELSLKSRFHYTAIALRPRCDLN